MKYYLYFDDDRYHDERQKGLAIFADPEDAITFIERHMSIDPCRKLLDYRLVYGEERPLHIVETVKKIAIGY